MSGRAFFIVMMFHWSVWMLQERSRASPKYQYPSIMSNSVCNINNHVLYLYPSIMSNSVCNTNSHVLYWYRSIMSNSVCNRNSHVLYWYPSIMSNSVYSTNNNTFLIFVSHLLQNRKFKRLGGPLDEIVTVSVGKYSVTMPHPIMMSWHHLIRETGCQGVGCFI